MATPGLRSTDLIVETLAPTMAKGDVGILDKIAGRDQIAEKEQQKAKMGPLSPHRRSADLLTTLANLQIAPDRSGHFAKMKRSVKRCPARPRSHLGSLRANSELILRAAGYASD